MEKFLYSTIALVGVSILLFAIVQVQFDLEEIKETKPTVETIIIEKDLNTEFSEERLIEEINKMNFERPSIILAQAKLETGHFKSRLFKENHNLFGMKKAWARPTTALGEKGGHAYYHDWRDSLIDYALYQSRYVKRGISKTDYLTQLNETYAADPLYDVKLRNIIDRENLIQHFQ